jgi:hypothetical protein
MRQKRQRDIEERFGEPIEDLLYRLYYVDEMGLKKIAEKIDVSDRNLWNWFEDFNIPRRSRSKAVELQWRNNDARRRYQAHQMRKQFFGIDEPLPDEWESGQHYRGPGWNTIRKNILERDNHCCKICGSSDKLHIHHIVPYKISKDNSPENLVTLCPTCHVAVEPSRNHSVKV